MNTNSTERFSKTVDNYVKYRPGYPQDLVYFMQKQLGLKPDSLLADVGAGTGKLAELFVKTGIQTFGVEPNGPMREAAQALLGDYPNFVNSEGTAERTGLPDQSVDFITAAQAFHWFDVKKFRSECLRILKSDGWVLLIWNKRMDERSPFMEAYNTFLENYSTDYNEINLRRINTAHFEQFYGHSDYQMHHLVHYQHFDLDGVMGRYLSCSYAYDAAHPKYDQAMQKLESIYQQHELDNHIKMWYKTAITYGKMSQ